VATIQAYEEDGLLVNTAEMGKYLGTRLESMKRTHSSVGDVRYIGLFSALEIVGNKNKKTPIDPLTEIGKFLRDNGLFTFLFHNILFVVPPLCITTEQLEEGLSIVEKSLDITDALCEA
jgi:taurine--2-oxoglutarate transaminase